MAAVKLTKSERDKIDVLQEQLEKASEKLTEAADEYNDKLEKLNASLNDALESYKRTVGKVRDFSNRVTDRLTSSIEDRTEDWQESDDGQASTEFRDQWQEFHEAVETHLDTELEIVLPDPVELPDLFDNSYSLHDLPQEADGE